ncbi:hypothetical protein D3C72_2111270 [compost metagenome]
MSKVLKGCTWEAMKRQATTPTTAVMPASLAVSTSCCLENSRPMPDRGLSRVMSGTRGLVLRAQLPEAMAVTMAMATTSRPSGR